MSAVFDQKDKTYEYALFWLDD